MIEYARLQARHALALVHDSDDWLSGLRPGQCQVPTRRAGCGHPTRRRRAPSGARPSGILVRCGDILHSLPPCGCSSSAVKPATEAVSRCIAISAPHQVEYRLFPRDVVKERCRRRSMASTKKTLPRSGPGIRFITLIAVSYIARVEGQEHRFGHVEDSPATARRRPRWRCLAGYSRGVWTRRLWTRRPCGVTATSRPWCLPAFVAG